MRKIEHQISERLASKLAEIRQRQSVIEEIEPDNAQLKLSDKPSLERVPHEVSDKLKAKLQQNRERNNLIEGDALSSVKQDLRKCVELHYAQLSRILQKSIDTDDYGNFISDGRLTASENFIHSMIKRGSLPLSASSKYLSELREFVIDCVALKEEKHAHEGFDLDGIPDDAFQFEHWVASGLKKFGWHAHATQGGGDQGVDVIATKNEITWAIQCKLYSQPVGNKAVQEAFSGAKHYKANRAAVLTNAGYTKSARELAASTGVRLLSPEDIPTLRP